MIVLNALVFMHKARHFPLDLPRSLRKTVAENSPLSGATHESSNEWLRNLSYHLYTRSVFYKGPLMSIIPEISELVSRHSSYPVLRKNLQKNMYEKP